MKEANRDGAKLICRSGALGAKKSEAFPTAPPFRFLTRHDSSVCGNASLEVLLEEFQQALGQVEPRCLGSESVLFSRLEVEIEECARLD